VRVILVALIAVTLAGCGYYRWHKDGEGTEGFQRDSTECEQQAAAGKWESCMTGKGWIYGGRF
jgi:hypothetical protein